MTAIVSILAVGCRSKIDVAETDTPEPPADAGAVTETTDETVADEPLAPAAPKALDATFNINSGSEVTPVARVVLKFAKPQGIKQFRTTNELPSTAACTAQAHFGPWRPFDPSGNQSHDLSAGDGPKLVCVEVDGGEGTTVAVASSTILLDGKAPQIAQLTSPRTTRFRDVKFKPKDSESKLKFRFDAKGGCDDAVWQDVEGAEISVQLPDKDGSYAACLQLQDAAGNASKVQTEAILLDRKPPTGSITTTGNLGEGFGPGDTFSLAGSSLDDQAGLESVTVKLQRDDGLCLKADATFGACPSNVVPTISNGQWTFGLPVTALLNAVYQVSVEIKDGAGNGFAPDVSTFTWYLPPPIAKIVGVPATKSKLTTLDLTVSGVGVATYVSQYGSAGSIDCSLPGDYSPTFVGVSTPFSVDLSAVPDGLVRVCVLAKDVDDNEQPVLSATTATWVKDTVAPSLSVASPTIVSVANAQNFQSLPVNGTCDEEGAKVHVTSGTAVQEALCTAGSFNLTLDLTPVADGAVDVAVSLADEAGNLASSTIQITKDVVLPAGATLSGEPALFDNVSALNVTVGGADVAAYRFAVLAGGAASCAGATLSSAVGIATLITEALGADGIYQICVVGRDSAGNDQAAATVYSFTKDTVAPAMVGLSGTPANPSNTTSLNVTVSGVGVTHYRSEKLGGGSADCSGATYPGGLVTIATPITGAVGADDTYRLCVIGQDAAGNVQAGATTVSWVKDTQAPAMATLTGAPADPSAETTLDVTVGGAGIVQFKAQLLGGGPADCSAATYPGGYIDVSTHVTGAIGSDGSYRLCVIGRDAAGNDQAAASSAAWTKDSLAPSAVTLSGVPAAASNATTLDVTVTGAGVVDYKYELLGGGAADCSSATYPGGSTAIATHITGAIGADDAYRLCVVGRDGAGNAQGTATTAAWTKDTAAPANVTLSGMPTDPSNVTALNVAVSGPGATQYAREVLGGAAADCSAATYPQGFVALSTNITDTLGADDTYRICVLGRDAAGNEQATATSFAWTKDTAPPASATLNGTPSDPSNVGTLDVTVGGVAITEYKYQILGAAAAGCSAATYPGGYRPVATHVTDTLSGNDGYRLCVIGRDAALNEQATVTSYAWTYDTNAPASATLNGVPANPSNATTLDVTVGGIGIATYKYAVLGGGAADCAAATYLSGYVPVATHITDAIGADDTYRLCVVGKSSAGNDQAAPTTYSWVKDTAPPASASLSGVPTDPSSLTSLDVTVSGAGIVEYESQLLGAAAADCSTATYPGGFVPVATHVTGSIGSDDSYRLCVVGRDAAGNAQVAATSASWVKDTAAPAAATLSGTPADPSNATTLNVTVAGADIAEYKYQLLGSAAANCSAATYPGGFVSVGTLITGAIGADDTYRLCVVGRDGAGNQQATVTTYSWAKDTAVPANATLSGVPADPSNATTLDVTVSGTGISEYQYELLGASAADCSTATYPGGFVSVATHITGSIGSDDTYRLCVVGRDAAHNAQVSATSATWTKDTAAPSSASLSGVPSSPSNDVALNVTVSGSGIASYKYQVLGGGAADCSSATYPSGFVAVATPITDAIGVDDTYRICVIGRDAAGNSQVAATTAAWVKDTAAPASATLSGTPADPSNATTLDVTVGGAEIAEYKYEVLGASVADCSTATFPSGFVAVATHITGAIGSDDTYRVCVVGRDAAGNPQTVATSFSWTKDTAVPGNVTLGGAPAALTTATTLDVTVSGTGVTHYKYQLLGGGAANCAAATYAGGYVAIATHITDAIGSDDSYRLCVVGRDAAGNDQASATSAAFTKDTAGPGAFDVTAPVTYSAAAATVVTWSASAGAATYDLKVDDSSDCASPVQTYTGETGTTKTTTSLSDGTYYICMTARDAATNGTDATTSPKAFVVDTQAPNTPSTPTDAGAYSGTTVTFNWSATTDNGSSGVVSYTLQVGTTPGGTDVLNLNVGNVLTYDVSGTGGVTYYARVRANDNAGNPSSFSSNSDGVLVDASAPTGASSLHFTKDAIGGPAATADDDTQIFLVWSAGSDGESGLSTAAPYEVTWYATSNCTGTAHVVGSITALYLTLDAPDIVSGSAYSFKVKTSDKAGNNVTSACLGSMTIDTTPPPALTAFSGVSGTLSGRIDLSWTYPGSTADYYQMDVYRSAPSGTTGVSAPSCGAGTLVNTLTSFGSTTYTDNTQNAGKYFSYRACISDLAGNVTSSNTAVDVKAKDFAYLRAFDAADINGDGTPNSGDMGSYITNAWGDISAHNNASLGGGFDYNATSSGWDGNGTNVTDPYVLRFDGTDDSVTMGTMQAYALMFWFNADTIPTANLGTIYGNGWDSQIGVQNNSLVVSYNVYSAALSTSAAIAPGLWYHFALTVSGNVCKVFLNGNLFHTKTPCSVEPSAAPYLGRAGYGAQYYFDGKLATFSAFATAPSDTEVASIYANDRPRFVTDPGVVAVSQISPAVGLASGGTQLQIYGWHLSSVAAVTFGGTPATSFTVNSDSSITATAPAKAVGWHQVQLVGAQTATVPKGYRSSGVSSSTTSYLLEAQNINGSGGAGNGRTDAIWASLVSGERAGLSNFSLPADANSGWDGTGGYADPYRLKFDGANDVLTLGQMQPYGMSLWLKPDVNTAASKCFYGHGWDSSFCVVDGKIATSYNYYSSAVALDSGIPASTWVNFAFTTNGSLCTMYVNGDVVGTQSCSIDPFGSSVLGQNNGSGSNFFDGSIGLFRTFSAAPSAADVRTLFEEERPDFLQDPGAPVVESMYPSIGAAGGGQTVTIRGWRLSLTTDVKFGGVSGTGLQVLSDSAITVVTPARSAGWSDVVLTVNGSPVTLSGSYRYTGTTLTGLSLMVDGVSTNGKGGHGPSDAATTWSSLMGPTNVGMIGFANPGDANSGWIGDGSTGNPYVLRFDGSDDYLSATKHAARAYMMWFKADSVASGTLLSRGYDTSISLSSGSLTFYYNSYSAGMSSSTAVSAGTWYHVAFVYDGANTCRTYLNGVVQATDTSCGIEPSTVSYFGKQTGGGNGWFDGSLGSIRIYTTASPTGTDVVDVYNEEKARYGL